MNKPSAIYTFPEPYQGFIRVDSILSAIAYQAIPEAGIKDRMIIRYGFPHDKILDMKIECDDFETASLRANSVRRMVEDFFSEPPKTGAL